MVPSTEIISVAVIIEAGRQRDAILKIREDSLPNDPSHSVIIGIELDAALVQAAVALATRVLPMTSF
jgi:hypothetical protein